MFFSQEILTKRKKGSYAIVWMSANFAGKTGLGKKLTKRDILAQNLTKLCEGITMPEEPLALRLSATLMLGVARIYGQQVSSIRLLRLDVRPEERMQWQILQSDVQEAQQRIKKAFVDLYNVRNAGGARSLEMPNPKASRSAITRETPAPDEQGFWLDLDEYTFGPVYAAAKRSPSPGLVIPGLDTITEEDEDEVGKGEDEEGGRPSKRRKTGEDAPQERPEPKNIVTDDRLINLNEYDLDEPLDKEARRSRMDLGVGDFDLGFDAGFGDFGGPPGDSSINQDGPPLNHDQDFMQEYGGGDGYGNEPDYNDPSGPNEVAAPVDDDHKSDKEASHAHGQKRSLTDSDQDGKDDDIEEPPPKKKTKKKARSKKAGTGQVDEAIVMTENPIRIEDRRKAMDQINTDIKKAEAQKRSKEQVALAQRMVFGAPQEIIAPDLLVFWKSHVHIEADAGKDKKAGQQAKKKRKRPESHLPTPPPEGDVGRGIVDDWNFAPDAGGSYGSGEHFGGEGYGMELDYDVPRASLPGSEVGRGDSQAGRLSDIMPWDAAANERDSDIQGGHPSIHEGSRRSMSFSRAGTPIELRPGRRSSTPMRGSDVGGLNEMQMDGADLGTNEADMIRLGVSKQAANFYDYAKRQSISDELLFSDVAPVTSSSATIAATAFYHVLTLASKQLLRVVEQETPYGEIRLGIVQVEE